MKTVVKFALIALVAGIPAFLLTPTFFPAPAGAPMPTDHQMPYFLAITAIETLFFGVGVAFVILGFPLVRRVARISGVSPWPAYLAISYLTVSWWPHLGMHRVTAMDLQGLLMVDYTFHLPYIIAAVVVAHFFMVTIRAALERDEVETPERTAVTALDDGAARAA